MQTNLRIIAIFALAIITIGLVSCTDHVRVEYKFNDIVKVEFYDEYQFDEENDEQYLWHTITKADNPDELKEFLAAFNAMSFTRKKTKKEDMNPIGYIVVTFEDETIVLINGYLFIGFDGEKQKEDYVFIKSDDYAELLNSYKMTP